LSEEAEFFFTPLTPLLANDRDEQIAAMDSQLR
jgi:hypothetical protein